MRVTISGATGFIGPPLVERLLDAGHYVTALSRTRSNRLSSRAAWAPWNPVTEEPPPEAINSADAIIHLAGEPVAQRWTPDVKKRIRESRVLGTRNLVQAIGKAKFSPKLLISSSAVGYYGDRGDEILTETSTPGSGFLPEVCMEWEREALAANIRTVLLRTGVVLGRGGGALEKMLLPFRAGIGGKVGSGRQWIPWIHLTDIISMLMFSLTTDRVAGPLNGTAPEPVRNSEFTKSLAAVLHRPAIVPVPVFGLKLLYGEMASVTVESQRAIPAAVTAAGFQFQFNDVRSALADAI